MKERINTIYAQGHCTNINHCCCKPLKTFEQLSVESVSQ